MLAQMRDVHRAGARRRAGAAHTGKTITDVVNIGIGGSDLGPAHGRRGAASPTARAGPARRTSSPTSTARTSPRRSRSLDPETHAVHRRLQDLHHPGDDDQRRARRAPGWLAALGATEAVAKHFVALSTNAEEVAGVRHRHRQHVRVLGLGRRPLLAVVGDRPVRSRSPSAWTASRSCWPAPTRWTSTSATAPLEQNLPVILALLGVWYNNFLGAETARHPALRPVPAPLRRLLPAGRHGEQRQVRATATAQRGRLSRPARSSGASRAPTASTPSTS